MKNLKKTLKKFRKVRLSLSMKIISLLSCIALVSMGFASWWIIKIDTGTTMGSFVTYEVDEKNIHIDGFTSLIDADSHPDIVFGAPANSINGWLQVHDETQNEQLSFTYTFDLWAKGEDVRALVDSVDLILTPTTTVAANIATAVTKGYINAPTVVCKINNAEVANVALSGSNLEAPIDITSSTATTTANKTAVGGGASEQAVTVSVTIAFTWGQAFGGSNPYTYFNALESDGAPQNTNTFASAYSTNADFAIAALTELNALLGNQTDAYEITYEINLVQN